MKIQNSGEFKKTNKKNQSKNMHMIMLNEVNMYPLWEGVVNTMNS